MHRIWRKERPRWMVPSGKDAGDEAMTPDYELALNAVREATTNFNAVTYAYRAGKITDDEFLAARKAYNEAERVFDAASAKEIYS